MKITTIALATALALTSSAALAQATYAPSIGSVVAPSVRLVRMSLQRWAHT